MRTLGLALALAALLSCAAALESDERPVGLLLPGAPWDAAGDQVCLTFQACHDGRGAAHTSLEIFASLEARLERLGVASPGDHITVTALTGQPCVSPRCCCASPVAVRLSLPLARGGSAAALVEAVLRFAEQELPQLLPGAVCVGDVAECDAPIATARRHLLQGRSDAGGVQFLEEAVAALPDLPRHDGASLSDLVFESALVPYGAGEAPGAYGAYGGAAAAGGYGGEAAAIVLGGDGPARRRALLATPGGGAQPRGAAAPGGAAASRPAVSGPKPAPAASASASAAPRRPAAPGRQTQPGACYCRYVPAAAAWALDEPPCRAALYGRCGGGGALLECAALDGYYRARRAGTPAGQAPGADAVSAFLYVDCPPAPPCSCKAAPRGAGCCADLKAACQVPFSGLDCGAVARFCAAKGAPASDEGGLIASFVLVRTHGADCKAPAHAAAYAAVADAGAAAGPPLTAEAAALLLVRDAARERRGGGDAGDGGGAGEGDSLATALSLMGALAASALVAGLALHGAITLVKRYASNRSPRAATATAAAATGAAAAAAAGGVQRGGARAAGRRMRSLQQGSAAPARPWPSQLACGRRACCVAGVCCSRRSGGRPAVRAAAAGGGEARSEGGSPEAPRQRRRANSAAREEGRQRRRSAARGAQDAQERPQQPDEPGTPSSATPRLTWRSGGGSGAPAQEQEQAQRQREAGEAERARDARRFAPAAPPPGFFRPQTGAVTAEEAEAFLLAGVNQRWARPLTNAERAELVDAAPQQRDAAAAAARRALPPAYRARLAAASEACAAALAAARRRPGGLGAEEAEEAEAVAEVARLTRSPFTAELALEVLQDIAAGRPPDAESVELVSSPDVLAAEALGLATPEMDEAVLDAMEGRPVADPLGIVADDLENYLNRCPSWESVGRLFTAARDTTVLERRHVLALLRRLPVVARPATFGFRTRLRFGELVADLFEQLVGFKDGLTAPEVAGLAAPLAQLGPHAARDGGLAAALPGMLDAHAAQLSLRQLADLLWGGAKAQLALRRGWVARLWREMAGRARQTPADSLALAKGLYACALLGHAPPRQQLRAFYAASTAHFGRFTPQQAGHTLWAAASLGLQPPPAWLAAALAALTAGHAWEGGRAAGGGDAADAAGAAGAADVPPHVGAAAAAAAPHLFQKLREGPAPCPPGSVEHQWVGMLVRAGFGAAGSGAAASGAGDSAPAAALLLPVAPPALLALEAGQLLALVESLAQLQLCSPDEAVADAMDHIWVVAAAAAAAEDVGASGGDDDDDGSAGAAAAERPPREAVVGIVVRALPVQQSEPRQRPPAAAGFGGKQPARAQQRGPSQQTAPRGGPAAALDPGVLRALDAATGGLWQAAQRGGWTLGELAAAAASHGGDGGRATLATAAAALADFLPAWFAASSALLPHSEPLVLVRTLRAVALLVDRDESPFGPGALPDGAPPLPGQAPLAPLPLPPAGWLRAAARRAAVVRSTFSELALWHVLGSLECLLDGHPQRRELLEPPPPPPEQRWWWQDAWAGGGSPGAAAAGRLGDDVGAAALPLPGSWLAPVQVCSSDDGAGGGGASLHADLAALVASLGNELGRILPPDAMVEELTCVTRLSPALLDDAWLRRHEDALAEQLRQEGWRPSGGDGGGKLSTATLERQAAAAASSAAAAGLTPAAAAALLAAHEAAAARGAPGSAQRRRPPREARRCVVPLLRRLLPLLLLLLRGMLLQWLLRWLLRELLRPGVPSGALSTSCSVRASAVRLTPAAARRAGSSGSSSGARRPQPQQLASGAERPPGAPRAEQQQQPAPAQAPSGGALVAGVAAAAAAALAAAGPAAAAGLDAPAAAALESVLRPVFTLFTVLYIVRIPLTWYPSIDGTKLPWLLAVAPTEPFLRATRAVIPAVGGVDVTPIVWVGVISFLNEILLGPQGILLLIQRESGAGLL
ncbi:CCB3 [Scenedesmus sp. PABB004]|nr:CCB3 [Scenedesmus sp. PABB004]